MSRMDGKKTHTHRDSKYIYIYIYIYQTRSSLESRCTVNKRGIRAQDRNTIVREKLGLQVYGICLVFYSIAGTVAKNKQASDWVGVR